MSDFFYNKDSCCFTEKTFFLYTNAHFNGEDDSRKIWISNEETESRNGLRNQIAMTEKYYVKIPWHWNVQNISTPISEADVDVYHKDKPVQK